MNIASLLFEQQIFEFSDWISTFRMCCKVICNMSIPSKQRESPYRKTLLGFAVFSISVTRIHIDSLLNEKIMYYNENLIVESRNLN